MLEELTSSFPSQEVHISHISQQLSATQNIKRKIISSLPWILEEMNIYLAFTTPQHTRRLHN